MSAYMAKAMTSKDIDLIAPGVTANTLDSLTEALSAVAAGKPVYDHQVGEYLGRRYPVSHIYMKYKDGYPFAVEFFETFLGYESTKLAPFLTFKEKWGLWLQVPSAEAIIGTRLAFRPPERITPTNAARLNSFIRRIRKVDWSEVNAFIDTFELRPIIAENIATLKSKRISIIGLSNVMHDRESRPRSRS
jgi:hypothetical protein